MLKSQTKRLFKILSPWKKKIYGGAEMTGSMQKEPSKLFRQQVARI